MKDLSRVAAEIHGAGIRHVFGIPGGGTSLGLFDALGDHGIEVHVTQFEGTAAVMAGTLGRITGVAHPAVSIKGPGLANMASGLAACALESLPVVALAEAYPSGGSKTTTHKAMDHQLLTAAISKGRRALARTGPSYTDVAAWAQRETPGPVLFELPSALAKNEQPIPTEHKSRKGPALPAILETSQRPVVVAGTIAARRGWAEALSALSIPVFSTAAAKGVVDERAPHSAGVLTGVGLDLAPEAKLLANADLIVGFGLRASELLAYGSFPCPVINVDDDTLGHQKTWVSQTVSAARWPQVFDILNGKEWGIDEIDLCRRFLMGKLVTQEFLPAQVYQILHAHFGRDIRLAVDTGYFCTVGEHVWLSESVGSWLGAGQSRYMGLATPMALATSIQSRDVPTILVTGDGGIGMYLGELKMAVEMQLPLLVLLMSDGGFGSIRTRAIRDGLNQAPLIFPERSWVATMDGLGFAATTCANGSQLESGLRNWSPTQGPGFIEAKFDSDSYQSMLEGVR